MNRFETFILGAIVVLVAWVAVLLLDGPDDPKRNSALQLEAAVGKCLQAQRVLYQVDRAQAAEACLTQLDADPDKFERTWRNYKTEAGSW